MPEKPTSAQRLAALTPVGKEMLRIVNEISQLKDDDGQATAFAFQTLPPRRLTTYYKVIKRPVSLFLVKQNIMMQKYGSFMEFTRDMAQMIFNAKLYNRSDSEIYVDAENIEKYLREELDRMANAADQGEFGPEELQWPELGPVPDLDDSDKEFEDSMINALANVNGLEPDARDSAVNGGAAANGTNGGRAENGTTTPLPSPRRLRRSGREVKSTPAAVAAAAGVAGGVTDDDDSARVGSALADARRKRGRPPTVDRPHEHRIKNILRGVRRIKGDDDELLTAPFEKLPDHKLYPDYYTQIHNPIALDIIKKNIKSRKYGSVDDFLHDMNLMFDNAKYYNADESQLYHDAVALQTAMMAVAKEELEKPDSVFQEMGGANSKIMARVPLDHAIHKGVEYKVGDWVHIMNPNDPSKPTVGQIFRIWRTAQDDQKWINACWYYRPEQTVHRYDRLFYENEVAKSGQYRDHLVDEIQEKCFVMYFSRYLKGRPAGVDLANTTIYCCESRYNEVDKVFNRIRTWRACLPDEVRQFEYNLIPFEHPFVPNRIVSPLRHLLPPDATDSDPIPDAKMGVPNAPPAVGAVYKRPYDPNDPDNPNYQGYHKNQKLQFNQAQRLPPLQSPGSITVGNPAQSPAPSTLSTPGQGSGPGSLAGTPIGFGGTPTNHNILNGLLGSHSRPNGPNGAALNPVPYMPRPGALAAPFTASPARFGTGFPSPLGPAGGTAVPFERGGTTSGMTTNFDHTVIDSTYAWGDRDSTKSHRLEWLETGLQHPLARPFVYPPSYIMPTPRVSGSYSRGAGQQQQQQQYNPPVYVPPAPQSTFTLPDKTQGLLPTEELGSVAKATSGQMAWFTMPPVYVANRLRADEPLRHPMEFTVEEQSSEPKEKRPRVSVGHSAKYLAWKLEQANAK